VIAGSLNLEKADSNVETLLAEETGIFAVLQLSIKTKNSKKKLIDNLELTFIVISIYLE
jgi:uncharacterized membrane protein